MAKTIKFNLICNEKPIRTIEDLQDNFVIEDVLDLYKNKLLGRWLDVRGYEKQKELVSKIESSNDLDIIKELIKIFEFELNPQEIEESVYIYEYKKQKEAKFKEYLKEELEEQDRINNYIRGYNEQVSKIFVNSDDAPIIKSCIKTIIDNYYHIFKLNYRELFYILLKDKSLLAILCLLMYEETRKFYICDSNDKNVHPDIKKMYYDICNELRVIIKKRENLGGNIVYHKEFDKGRYESINENDCMILDLNSCESIREFGTLHPTFGDADIRPKREDNSVLDFSFRILKGFEHQGHINIYKTELAYMEI